MTPFLIFARLAIIAWIWCSMLPIELACDAIDDELERREFGWGSSATCYRP